MCCRFVRFVRKESAIEAILALNGCILRGRPVAVEFSKDNPEKEEVEREILRRSKYDKTRAFPFPISKEIPPPGSLSQVKGMLVNRLIQFRSTVQSR